MLGAMRRALGIDRHPAHGILHRAPGRRRCVPVVIGGHRRSSSIVIWSGARPTATCACANSELRTMDDLLMDDLLDDTETRIGGVRAASRVVD
jgi:hypothetical protein